MPKYKLPNWAREPQLENCALEVYKSGKRIGTITRCSRNKSVIFGRNKEMADVLLQHPSISRRHAVLLHGKSGNMYVMDLGSSHGTFINKKRLKRDQREVLQDGDTVKFGASSREYVVRLCLEKNSKGARGTKRKGDDTSEKRKKKRKKSETGDSVGCSHLLVKHEESRRPSSWKEDKITRSKTEAREAIAEYKKQIEEADGVEKKFAELAKKYSDCNSHMRGGDLGKFRRGKMQKPFEECAFSLKVGELSDPVETASGIHLILRTS